MLFENGHDLRRPIKYRPDVDGLRAVAIFIVVIYHANPRWMPGGFIGVDVFFVISGYLIGTLVYKEIRGSSFSISKFYARRAKRILPVLVTVLAASYVGAFLILPPSAMHRFSFSALSTLASGSNLYFWRALDYFHGDGRNDPLLMTWSLGVEEQFYLLFPLLLLLMRKRRWQTQFLVLALLAGGSFAFSCWSVRNHPVLDFYVLPTRAWELGAGVLLAIFESNRAHERDWIPPNVAHVLGLLGIGMIASAFFWFDGKLPFPGYLALLPVTGAVLVIAARSGVTNWVLGLRPLVFVGLVSYSWYLWHWPIFSFAHIIQQTSFSAQQVFFLAGLSFLFAFLTFKLIEQPFRTSTTPAAVLLKRYAFVLAVAALPPLVAFVANGLPQRNSAVAILDASQEHLHNDPCFSEQPSIELLLHAPCVPPGNGPAVALIGDSHAAAISQVIRASSERAGYRFIEFSQGDCVALDERSSLYKDKLKITNECVQFNHERIDYILQDPSIQTVVIVGYWAEVLEPPWLSGGLPQAGQNSHARMEAQDPSLLQTGLDQLVGRLRSVGKRVYLMGDNPIFFFNPSEVAFNKAFWARRILAMALSSPTVRYEDGVAPELTPPAVSVAGQVLEKVAAAHPGTIVVDLHSALCNAQGCRFLEGDRTLYLIDENHLSEAGAQVALNGFEFK